MCSYLYACMYVCMRAHAFVQATVVVAIVMATLALSIPPILVKCVHRDMRCAEVSRSRVALFCAQIVGCCFFLTGLQTMLATNFQISSASQKIASPTEAPFFPLASQFEFASAVMVASVGRVWAQSSTLLPDVPHQLNAFYTRVWVAPVVPYNRSQLPPPTALSPPWSDWAAPVWVVHWVDSSSTSFVQYPDAAVFPLGQPLPLVLQRANTATDNPSYYNSLVREAAIAFNLSLPAVPVVLLPRAYQPITLKDMPLGLGGLATMVLAAVLFHVLWGIAHRRDRQRAQHPVWRRGHDADVEEDGDADRIEDGTANPEEKEQFELPTIVVPTVSRRELGLALDDIDIDQSPTKTHRVNIGDSDDENR
jgi:hypothetical protein